MNILNLIDHTNLNAYTTSKDIEKLCSESIKYQFASVCINPIWVKQAKSFLTLQNLGNTNISVCTVIDFPLGASSTKTKATEASNAIEDGADEIDMVMNIGAAKEGDWNIVETDIKTVVVTAKKIAQKVERKVIIKIILENCYLTKTEIVKACECAKNAGADFVKTSTGFGTPHTDPKNPIPVGATVEDVALMRKTVGSVMGVKAAGGIHTLKEAQNMVKAGASRLGCSSSLHIANEVLKEIN